MTRLIARLLCLALSLLAASSAASAHDFWLEPADTTPEPGSVFPLHLRVGHPGEADAFPRRPDHVVRFEHLGPDGARALPGQPGAEPAAVDRMPQAGSVIAVYRSARSRVDMPAAAFEDYLYEEGLDAALELRGQRGDSDRPGRELYSRCAKALLAVGGVPAPGFDRVVGLTAELIPLQHPLALSRGDDGRLQLPVRLLVGGAPAAKVLVHALPLDAPGAAVFARTDADGETSLSLPADAGERFVVMAVHALPAADVPVEGRAIPLAADVDRRALPAEWESLWASLVLPVGARDASVAAETSAR